MKLQLLVELDYNDKLMHNGDENQEAKDWFFSDILGCELVLHSNELGDEVGSILVLKIIDGM